MHLMLETFLDMQISTNPKVFNGRNNPKHVCWKVSPNEFKRIHSQENVPEDCSQNREKETVWTFPLKSASLIWKWANGCCSKQLFLNFLQQYICFSFAAHSLPYFLLWEYHIFSILQSTIFCTWKMCCFSLWSLGKAHKQELRLVLYFSPNRVMQGL